MPIDYLKLAIKYAERGRGKCSPNPFVGAVIVKDNTVVGYGWTQPYGFDHAEIQALKMAGEKAKGATLYVTLEPCCHYGKTPPCTDAIVAAGITEVIAGITDPNPRVNGKGFAVLRESGIAVQSGFHEDMIKLQLEYYLTYITLARPFVTYKAAMSWDGKYSASDGSSQWISNSLSRLQVHRMRREADVIMTGINTVLADNPQLNVRGIKTAKQPTRVILDPELSLPLESEIARTASMQRTIVYYSAARQNNDKAQFDDRIPSLQQIGIELNTCPAKGDILDLTSILHDLAQKRYYAVLLESGSRLASAFLQENLIDKVVLFYGNKLIGGEKALLREYESSSIDSALALENIKLKRFGDDMMVSGYPVYRNK